MIVKHINKQASYHPSEVFKQLCPPYQDNAPRRMPEVWRPLVPPSSPSAVRQASHIYTSSSTLLTSPPEFQDVPDQEFAHAGATQQWRAEVQV